MALPQHLTTRPATPADFAAIVDLKNAFYQQVNGTSPETLENLTTDWTAPTFDLAHHTLLTWEGERLVASFALEVMPPGTRPFLMAHVHPDYLGQGITEYGIKHFEQVTRDLLPTMPPGNRVTILTSCLEQDHQRRHVLEAQGFVASRHYLQMLIQLDQPIPAPQWATGFSVRQLQADDEQTFRKIHVVSQEAFKDHYGLAYIPYEQYHHFYFGRGDHFDPALCSYAVEEATGEMAGICMTLLTLEGDPALGYVDELAVLRTYRQKGLGLALLLYTFAAFKARGHQRMTLHVDADSLTGATRLYQKAGMHISRHFIEYEKVIRDGEELSTQSLD